MGPIAHRARGLVPTPALGPKHEEKWGPRNSWPPRGKPPEPGVVDQRAQDANGTLGARVAHRRPSPFTPWEPGFP